MNASVQFLEAAKREELIDRLKAQGYQVSEEESIGDARFDLVARRGTETVVYEIKAAPELGDSLEDIARQRARALAAGLNDFRLVVVHPPHEVQVEIEDLEQGLYDFLINHMPPELDELSTHTVVEDVSQVEIDAVTVTRETLQIRGTGVVDVLLQYGEPEPGDSGDSVDFPFHFDVTLDRDLHVLDGEIEVNTSSFDE